VSEFGGHAGKSHLPVEGDDDLDWLDTYYYDRYPASGAGNWLRAAAVTAACALLTFLLCYPASCVA